MKERKIKRISIVLAALFLLTALPVTAMAGKEATPSNAVEKAATPSNAEKEVIEETEAAAEISTSSAVAAAESVPEFTAEELIGTWTVDGVTTYQFKKNGSGSLILPNHKYAFRYTLKEDELTLKFSSKKIGEAVFTVSIDTETLILEKKGKNGTTAYTLEKTD